MVKEEGGGGGSLRWLNDTVLSSLRSPVLIRVKHAPLYLKNTYRSVAEMILQGVAHKSVDGC